MPSLVAEEYRGYNTKFNYTIQQLIIHDKLKYKEKKKKKTKLTLVVGVRSVCCGSAIKELLTFG